MAMTHNLLDAKVMHKRLFPRLNKFKYNVYYLNLDIAHLNEMWLPYNKWGLQSFYDKDHGARDGSNLEKWARDILDQHKIKDVAVIRLIAMPRILGYVFNPVSFWLCLDEDGQLRAVIYEVNNTFGERHCYVCAHKNSAVIQKDDVLTAQKLFHVSPFLEREGHYEFRIDYSSDKFGVWIDFFDASGAKKLMTALTGDHVDMTKKLLRKAFWRIPFVTVKSIMLIHWQAIKLLSKKIKYIGKPHQKDVRLSTSKNLIDK